MAVDLLAGGETQFAEDASPVVDLQASSRLSVRQERFCREYVIDGCGKRAYIRAGFAPKSAEVCASQLLRKPKVSARIAELQAEQARRLEFTADHVLRELIPLCMSNVADLIGDDGRLVEDLSGLPRGVTAAIESFRITRKPDGTVTVAVKLCNKIAALALAGKHVNVQAFNRRSTGRNSAPIVFDVVPSATA